MSPAARSSSAGLSCLLTISLAMGCVVALAVLGQSGEPARAGSAHDAATAGDVGGRPGPALAVPATGTLTTTVCLPLILRAMSPVVNVWSATYYGDPDLNTPVVTRDESRVDYDWGEGPPEPLVPSDHFSVRWTGRWHFDAGPYTFFMLADDGVRLWVDGQQVLDAWSEGQSRHYVTWSPRRTGYYSVRLEYFDATGSALVRLRWHRKDLYPRWTGQYYADALMESSEQYSRTLDAIQFEWAEGCPSGLPCDDFAVRWAASPFFEPGTTRLSVHADDGYQLVVDGVPLGGPGWHDGQGDVYYEVESTTLEQHTVVFCVHDVAGAAEARLLRESLEQPRWTAQYFPNVELLGVPEVTRAEDSIFYDWGEGKPHPSLSVSDYFSVRWTGSRYFRSGFYRFGIYADDGVRLWVDGELLLSLWRPSSGQNYAPVKYLQTGFHDVILEYFDNTGPAEIRLWWE